MLHITFLKYDSIIVHKAYYLFTCTCVSINSFYSHSHSHIRECNISKSTMSNCIEGITGEANIAMFWRDHYGSLLNNSLNTNSKESVCDSFKNILYSDGMLVSVNIVLKPVDNLESNKSAGMDGLNGECMKNADVILSVLLSFCFTCMLKHSYLPPPMLDSVIIPLVKNKFGDLSDKNNYRPIAISCIMPKVFENIILHRIEDYLRLLINSLGSKHFILLIYVFMR